MTTAQQTLAAVKANTSNCFIDTDHKVAEALARGATEVPGLTEAQVNETINLLHGCGYVESASFTPCYSHDVVSPEHPFWDVEDTRCGMHVLRFGDVETPWTYCRQAEVLSFDQACREYGLTPEELIRISVAAGDLIEHPNGGYIPGLHPSVVLIEPDEQPW